MQKVLLPGSYPQYSDSGHLLYAVQGNLWAVGFDLDRLEMVGAPVPVHENVLTNVVGSADFSVSANGTLVYVPGGAGSLTSRTLVWVDREGVQEPMPVEPGDYNSVQLSPDGARAVIQIGALDSSLEVYDLGRETPSLLNPPSMNHDHPIWTPDGEQIAWPARFGSGDRGIVLRAADGTGQVERLSTSDERQTPYSWSSDGRLVMVGERPETGADIGLLSMDGEGTIEWLLEGDSNEVHPDVSPNGRWMAYSTDESGQYEVFVAPFPNVEDRRWPISRDGGVAPQWGPDSRELFFQTREGMIMVATNETETTFGPGIPVPLAGGLYVSSRRYAPRAFDIDHEGQRLLAIKGTTVQEPEIHVVLNWSEELKRLVPID